jgi:tetratricopeptide (TPR) repeat protein
MVRDRRDRLFVATMAVTLLGAGPAEAKPQDDRSAAKAAQHFAIGTRLFQVGHFSAAIDGFERAYRLRPHFRVQCSIARCHERLGNAQRALAHYRRCLSEGAEATPIAPRIRASIGDLQRGLSQPVATEEKAKRAASGGAPLVVPSTPPVGEPDSAADPSPAKRGLSAKWFWIAAGTTVALAVTSAVLGAQTAGLKSDYDSDPTASGYERFIDRRLATNIFAVAAVLAGGSSVVLFYLTEFNATDRATPRAAMVGVSLQGTF